MTEKAHYLDLFGLEEGEPYHFTFEIQYGHENVGKTAYMKTLLSPRVDEEYAKRTALEKKHAAELKAADEAVEETEQQYWAARCYQKNAGLYLDVINNLNYHFEEEEQTALRGWRALGYFSDLLETRFHQQCRISSTLEIPMLINFLSAKQGLTNVDCSEKELYRLIRAFGKFSHHAQHLEQSKILNYWKEFIILILRLSTPDTAFDKLKEASEQWKLDPAKLQELIGQAKTLRGDSVEPEPNPKRTRLG